MPKFYFLLSFVFFFAIQKDYAKTFTVVNANNSGLGSLRAFVDSANNNIGTDTINFNIAPVTGIKIINITTVPLQLTDNNGVFINGYSQGGSMQNTNLPFSGNVHNANINIKLNNVGSTLRALNIASNNNIISGLIITNFGTSSPANTDNAITISGNNNKVLGCYIGMDETGLASNNQDVGIAIIAAAVNNEIGNGTAAGMNIISGNVDKGVYINQALNNRVTGNFIGVNKIGKDKPTGANQQKYGVYIDYSSYGNLIGDPTQGDGNVISCNQTSGIMITNSMSSNPIPKNNKIFHNIIGLESNGSTIPATTQAVGVNMQYASVQNWIGGYNSGEGNTISGHSSHGIFAATDQIEGLQIDSNYIIKNNIGTDVTASINLGNSGSGIRFEDGPAGGGPLSNNLFTLNTIAYNGGDGIRLNDYTFNTVNKNKISKNSIYKNGSFSGLPINLVNSANNSLSPPVISSAYVCDGVGIVKGTGGVIGDSIEVFKDSTTQAKVYLGKTPVTAGSNWILSGVVFSDGMKITATKIDINGNTSKLSIPVTFYYPIEINPGNDTLISNLDTIVLGDTGAPQGGSSTFTYNWTPNYNISNTIVSNPLVFPDVSTTYVLSVTDVVTGCVKTDSIKVLVGYSISGTIFNDTISDTIKYGGVGIFKVLSGTSKFPKQLFQAINPSNGSYQFEKIIPGQYVIKAIPDTTVYPDVLPMYYGNKFKWFNATIVVQINQDATGLDIILKKIKPLTGIAKIKGRVQEGVGYTSKVLGPGDPLDGQDVSLIDKSTNIPIALTTTDNSGNFEFANVPNGDYQIHIDVTGIPIDTNYLIDLSDGIDVTNIVATIDSDYIYFDNTTSISQITGSSEGIILYPNPVQNKLFIRYIDVESNMNFQLFDMLGKLIDEGRNDKQTQIYAVDLSNISEGAYILKLFSTSRVINRRIIISK